jgi:hypothetical protein
LTLDLLTKNLTNKTLSHIHKAALMLSACPLAVLKVHDTTHMLHGLFCEFIFSLWLSKPFAQHLTTGQWNEYVFCFQG